MNSLKIDADALFRAVTATGYKVLAYHLDLKTGEITSRTLRPDEVAAPTPGPSVKPLPKLGGDLTPKKDAQPFGPPPVAAKKKLFDDDGPKKPAFHDDFWKREEKQKPNLFADEFKREHGSKKLAEMFAPPEKKKAADPFAKSADAKPLTPDPSPLAEEPEDLPRIPAAPEELQREWK